MNCWKYEKLIALYVGEDLAEGQRARVEKHLHACVDCRNFASGLGQTQSGLRWLGNDTVTPAELASLRKNVLGEIENRQALGPALRLERFLFTSFHRRYAAAGVAVVAVALALGLWVVEDESPPSTDARTTIEEPVLPARPQAVDTAEIELPDPHELRATATPSAPAEAAVAADAAPHESADRSRDVVVKLLTEDSNIVIYWLLAAKTGGGA